MSRPFRPLAAVTGVGSTAVVRDDPRPLGLFAVEAARAAMADAGIGPEDVDGYVGEPEAPNRAAPHQDGYDEVSVAYAARLLRLDRLAFAVDVKTVGSWVATAAAALSAGLCRTLLVVRALTFTRGGAYNLASAPTIGGAEQFAAPYGLGALGARHALWFRRYMHEHGATREDLYRVVQRSRDLALANPYAVWRDRSVTRDEYMSAPPIADPMCRFDCDMPVTGAVALVMTRAEAASSAPNGAAMIMACEFRPAGAPLLPVGGFELADLDCAQLYDGFSPFVFRWLERMGVAPDGQATRFVADGGTAPDGPLPLNTFGGSLGEGRLRGIGHLREGVHQMRGTAGPRQLDHARTCLVQVGTPDSSWSVVLARSGEAVTAP